MPVSYWRLRTGQSIYLTATTGLLKGVNPNRQKVTIQFIPGSGPAAGSLLSILPSGAFSYTAPATIPATAHDSQGRHRQVVSFKFNLFAGRKLVGTFTAFITIIPGISIVPGGRGQGPRP